MTFAGLTYAEVVVLKERAEALNAVDLVRDLAKANAKVQYYEAMLDRLDEYRTGVNKL